jgi:glutamate 5-kinase
MSDKRKRMVIKFGTGILTEPAGHSLAISQFERLTAEVAELVQAGLECILVSSGAVGAGLMRLGLTERPKDLEFRPAPRSGSPVSCTFIRRSLPGSVCTLPNCF